MRLIAAAILILTGLGATGRAGAAGLSADDHIQEIARAYDRCIGAADNINLNFLRCGQARIESDEALLNATWKTAYGDLEAEAKPAMLAEERAWVAYKEKSCLWLNHGYGREGDVIGYPQCRAHVIEDRIRLLDNPPAQ